MKSKDLHFKQASQTTLKPQAEQLEFVPCEWILQDEYHSRNLIRGAEPCPDKRQRPHISRSPGQGDLPNPRIKQGSPALQADSSPAELPGKLNTNTVY